MTDEPAVKRWEKFDHTAAKHDVHSVPEWAEDMDVGDVLTLTAPATGQFEAPIVGFSTLFDMSYPVIEAPREHADVEDEFVETCVVELENLVEDADE